MVIDLASVGPGFAFPEETLSLDAASVAAYVAAVEDPYQGYAGPSGVAPALAVLALAMRGLTALLAASPGVIHVTQQLTVHRAVPLGSIVTSSLLVRGRSERRGFAALTLEARVRPSDGGTDLLEGSLLLLVPLGTGGGTNG
jgi:hypothetical protein